MNDVSQFHILGDEMAERFVTSMLSQPCQSRCAQIFLTQAQRDSGRRCKLTAGVDMLATTLLLSPIRVLWHRKASYSRADIAREAVNPDGRVVLKCW